MIDLLVKSGTECRPEMLHQYIWPARDPNGRVNIASMLDMQAWYVRNRYARVQSPPERLVNLAYIEAAAQRLGPFAVENTAGKFPGCR